MILLRWLVGGVAGGAVGVLAWVLVGYFLHAEGGWIAWLVGYLVGVGVRYASHLDDREESAAEAIVSALLALGAIFAAKAAVFLLLLSSISATVDDMVTDIEVEDSEIIHALADKIAWNRFLEKKPVHFANGKGMAKAVWPDDYPGDIRSEADKEWKSLGPEGQAESREKFKSQLASSAKKDAESGLRKSMGGGWNILWIALATITAFRIGYGSHGGE